MLGFSLTKILFTAAIVWAVWYFFIKPKTTLPPPAAGRDNTPQADPPARELAACPSCGVYGPVDERCECGALHGNGHEDGGAQGHRGRDGG